MLKYVSTWLLNPIIINVSTRGNAESIISLFVMLSLWAVIEGKIVIGAIAFGLSVHLKIYPIIYSFAIFFFIDHQKSLPILSGIFSTNRMKLFLWSAGTFLGVTAWMYFIYGKEFLHETYFYHIERKDIRHSFSLYFYFLYLTSIPFSSSSWISSFSSLAGLLAFLPQFLLCILLFTFRSFIHIFLSIKTDIIRMRIDIIRIFLSVYLCKRLHLWPLTKCAPFNISFGISLFFLLFSLPLQ